MCIFMGRNRRFFIRHNDMINGNSLCRVILKKGVIPKYMIKKREIKKITFTITDLHSNL